jgi:uncharacterized membrane protein YfcA
MAGGMILMGILLAFLPVPAAMLLHGITQLASNGWRAWLWRGEVDWRVFRQYALGSLVALAVFAGLTVAVSKPLAFVALGLMPFVALALPSGLRPRRRAARARVRLRRDLLGLSLMAGVSGPILDVFFARSEMSRQAVVATKASRRA